VLSNGRKISSSNLTKQVDLVKKNWNAIEDYIFESYQLIKSQQVVYKAKEKPELYGLNTTTGEK